MVLLDGMDSEREILQGVKRISNCQVRKLQGGHTTLGANGVWEERNQESRQMSQYFELDSGEMLASLTYLEGPEGRFCFPGRSLI